MTARANGKGFAEIGALVVAIVVVVVSARFSVLVPGSPVPQSLQTLAVVLVGAWLGPRGGAVSLSAYLVLGALGAPVFADGAGGLEYLMGPTLGYLVGFVLGASLMGWWARRTWGYGVVGFFAGAVAVHALILLLGWVRLGALTGPVAAWASGAAPFLVGGLAKSGAAALIWLAIRSRVGPPVAEAAGAPSADPDDAESETRTDATP